MRLSFEAKYVDCVDAIDGEILQVTFATLPPSHDDVERRSPYVLISRNFEFPGTATVEWHDGIDCDGGRAITEMILRRERVTAGIGRKLELDVTFRISDKKFAKLKSYLESMLGKRFVIAE